MVQRRGRGVRIMDSRFHGNDDISMTNVGTVENDAGLISAAEVEQEARGVESPVVAG